MGQPNLNTPIIAGWFFPLPPLAEQRRIVAKVDELMALVDALETQLASERAAATTLLAAVGELAGGGLMPLPLLPHLQKHFFPNESCQMLRFCSIYL